MLIKSVQSRLKTWISILKTLTVEPAALCLMTSALMSYLILQDLIIDRVCKVNLNYTQEICDSIVKVKDLYPAEELEVQKIAAQIRTQTSIIIHSLPLIFIIFLGPWSDTIGRKLLMFMGTFSSGLSHIGIIACCYFESINGHQVSLIANLLKSSLGANVAFSMASHSYIADTTDNSARTIRTGILSAASTLGVPVGFALGGTLRKASMGFIESFAISGIFSLVACLIVIFAVKNTRKVSKESKTDLGVSNTPCSEKNDGITSKEEDVKCWKMLYPRASIYKVIAIPFKKRENSDRLYICLLIITWICVAAPIHGEFGVMYLYLRHRLHWDAGDYGYFSMYNFIIGITGTILSMGLLKHILKLQDPLVGFIAGISQFSGCILYALANTATLMFLAPTVDLMNGTMHVVARSMISQIVLPDELGTTFTLIAILETLVPLVMDPVYSTLYRMTVDVFSGSFFLLSAALTIPPQIVYAWLVWERRSKSSTTYTVEKEWMEEGQKIIREKDENGVINRAFMNISFE